MGKKRGASDWEDEDLLTFAEASARLSDEIRDTRRRIHETEHALTAAGSSIRESEAHTTLAAERARLADLEAAAERIARARADAPG